MVLCGHQNLRLSLESESGPAGVPGSFEIPWLRCISHNSLVLSCHVSRALGLSIDFDPNLTPPVAMILCPVHLVQNCMVLLHPPPW